MTRLDPRRVPSLCRRRNAVGHRRYVTAGRTSAAPLSQQPRPSLTTEDRPVIKSLSITATFFISFASLLEASLVAIPENASSRRVCDDKFEDSRGSKQRQVETTHVARTEMDGGALGGGSAGPEGERGVVLAFFWVFQHILPPAQVPVNGRQTGLVKVLAMTSGIWNGFRVVVLLSWHGHGVVGAENRGRGRTAHGWGNGCATRKPRGGYE